MITGTEGRQTALLSQEGSGIAQRIPRGVVPQRDISRFALDPPRRSLATPPDSGGEFDGKNTRLFIVLAAFLSLAACRQKMADQPAYRPLQPSTSFSDGTSARLFPAGAIARGSVAVDKDIGQQETLPFPLTRVMLERGKNRFNIFCLPCHGESGDGQGIVVLRGLRHGPPSFHIDRLRQVPIGHFVDVISNGFGGMADYSAQISYRDRWAVAAYVRVLQYSQYAPIESLPVTERQRLEAEP